MRKRILVPTSLIILLLSLSSCIQPDYFSAYKGKNLVGHKALSDWTASRNDTYMLYETVSSADAGGTTGLPAGTTEIFRLENRNLTPHGDFEDVTTLAAAGWTASGGTNSISAAAHPLSGKAMRFELITSDYITYDMNGIADGAVVDGNYLFRFQFSGDLSETYHFELDSGGAEVLEFKPSVETANFKYSFPESFGNSIQITNFTVKSNDGSKFRINKTSDGLNLRGYLDNFRVLKNQSQSADLSIPYGDSGRANSLTLINGTYRFSVWVKKDPAAATTANRFDSSAVTLKLEYFKAEGTASAGSAVKTFKAADNSNFTSWTQLFLTVSNVQIAVPYNTTTEVLKLSIFPTDSTGGALTMDSGSILISAPALEYSATGSF